LRAAKICERATLHSPHFSRNGAGQPVDAVYRTLPGYPAINDSM
jgi:hypothetical protein